MAWMRWSRYAAHGHEGFVHSRMPTICSSMIVGAMTFRGNFEDNRWLLGSRHKIQQDPSRIQANGYVTCLDWKSQQVITNSLAFKRISVLISHTYLASISPFSAPCFHWCTVSGMFIRGICTNILFKNRQIYEEALDLYSLSRSSLRLGLFQLPQLNGRDVYLGFTEHDMKC